MATGAPYPTRPASPRFSIPLPRPLSIGLATAVMIVMAVALRIGVPIYRQQVAIREIEQSGGLVGTNPGGPAWLRRWTGGVRIKVLDEAVSVTFSATNVTHSDWTRLQSCPQLRTLTIDESQVAATDFVNLARLKSLRKLFLTGAQVTDSHVTQLESMDRLEFLKLLNTQVTDTGVAELQRALPGLKISR